eukprot:s909_g3.t1
MDLHSVWQAWHFATWAPLCVAGARWHFARQAWHLATWTSILCGRRSTWRRGPSLCVAGYVRSSTKHMAKDCDVAPAGKGGSLPKTADGKSTGKGKSKGKRKSKSHDGTTPQNQDAAVKSQQVAEPSSTQAAPTSTPATPSTAQATASSSTTSMGRVMEDVTKLVNSLQIAAGGQGQGPEMKAC